MTYNIAIGMKIRDAEILKVTMSLSPQGSQKSHSILEIGVASHYVVKDSGIADNPSTPKNIKESALPQRYGILLQPMPINKHSQ